LITKSYYTTTVYNNLSFDEINAEKFKKTLIDIKSATNLIVADPRNILFRLTKD